jgi:hypothetical protein
MEPGRFWQGFGAGIVATVAMSIVMIAGVLTGISPMPQPIPLALIHSVVGGDLPQAAILVLGAGAHLLYGGIFGGVLAMLAYPVTVAKGVLLGFVLWLVLQVFWLPFLGWGMFGAAITPMIAEATLVLHVIYGAIVGWLIDRHAREEPRGIRVWPAPGRRVLGR